MFIILLFLFFYFFILMGIRTSNQKNSSLGKCLMRYTKSLVAACGLVVVVHWDWYGLLVEASRLEVVAVG